jgi:hypothetical protein
MANIIKGLYVVALKILNFFTWWRYKAKILSPGKEISLLRGVEDEKSTMKKAIPRASKCPQNVLSSFPPGEGESAKCDYVNSFLGENAFIYSMGYYMKTFSHLRPESG